MTDQKANTQVLSYSREYLLNFKHIQKADSKIQSLFIVKAQASRSNQNADPNKVPATVEKSKGFRPDASRRANSTSLTPNLPSNGIGGKWRGKAGVTNSNSQGANSIVSPTTQNKPLHQKAAPKTDSKAQLQQWRTAGHQKENVANVSGSALKPSQKTSNKNDPAAMEFVKSVIAVRAAPQTPAPSEKISATTPIVTIESPSPVNSPAAPSPAKTPGGTIKVMPGSPATTSSPKTPGSSPKIIDLHQLEQRQKQIDYGHQTLGYIRYRLLVPKEKRSRDDPRTPKKSQACSKRSWDGQIKKWRRDLHKWDPEDPVAFASWLESDFVMQIIKNNIGTEILELISQVKERASKFENSPAAMTPCTPSPSPLSPVSRGAVAADSIAEDLEDEKIARKLVF